MRAPSLTLAPVVPGEGSQRAAGEAAAFVQAGRGGAGRAVVCRGSAAEPAGGMTLWKGQRSTVTQAKAGKKETIKKAPPPSAAFIFFG